MPVVHGVGQAVAEEPKALRGLRQGKLRRVGLDALTARSRYTRVILAAEPGKSQQNDTVESWTPGALAWRLPGPPRAAGLHGSAGRHLSQGV